MKTKKIEVGEGRMAGDNGWSAHVQIELLQGPVVGLCYILPGGCDVGLGSEEAT